MPQIKHILDPEKVGRIKELVDSSKRIVMTCHVSPDGDALGSTLAMAFALTAMGKTATVVTPDNPPRQLSFIPGFKTVVSATRNREAAQKAFANADLIICLDFNAIHRLDKMSSMLTESKAAKVLIDHHLNPEDFVDIVISHPESSSTCALIYRFLYDAGWPDLIVGHVAECLAIGIMTDTGNFAYNSNDPDIFYIMGDLVARGVDKDKFSNLIFSNNSESRLRLCSYAISEKMQVYHQAGTALITLSKDELNRFGYVKGDTEALVNVPLSIPGIYCSIFMRQDDDRYVKVSARSRGDFPVNKLCELHFNGGGHMNAAGGEYRDSIDNAESFVVKLILESAEPWNKN